MEAEAAGLRAKLQGALLEGMDLLERVQALEAARTALEGELATVTAAASVGLEAAQRARQAEEVSSI